MENQYKIHLTTKEFTMLNKFSNLNKEDIINDVSINKAVEYSDEPETLKELISKLDVKLELTGIKKHFNNDKEERLTGVFQISFDSGYITSFDFGFSMNDTEIFLPLQDGRYKGKLIDMPGGYKERSLRRQDEKNFLNDLLYTVLCSIKSDSYCNIPFDSFCDEYGYNTYSISAKTIWEKCNKIAYDINRSFTEEQISCMPS